MSAEPKIGNNVTGHGVTNGGAFSQVENGGNSDITYNNGQMYQGGNSVSRFITPGGNPIDNSQPAFPVFHRKFANPAPLGLMGFGATTFVLSMYNVQARGVTTPNVILGMALAYGGLCQLLAGMWEFAAGNTFGATAFSSYGGFWLSFGVLYIPQFEVVAAYGTNTKELDSALGIYLSAWFIVTFIFFIASMRSSIALCSLFFFLDLTFLFLFIGFFTGNVKCTKAGGGLGIFTAAIAGYIALAGMLTRDTSFFTLPVGELSRARAAPAS
jgi:succinate-acetate transporter protein